MRPSTTIRSTRTIKTTARPVASAASQRLFHFPCNLSNSRHSNSCAKLVRPQRDPVRSPNVPLLALRNRLPKEQQMLKVTRSLLMFAVGVGASFPTLASAQPSNAAGAVFVMTNAANKNEVIAFERNANGTLGDSVSYDPTAAAAEASLIHLSRKAPSPSARTTPSSSPSMQAAAASPSSTSTKTAPSTSSARLPPAAHNLRHRRIPRARLRPQQRRRWQPRRLSPRRRRPAQ